MNFTTISTILTLLLGGTNVLTIYKLIAERKKRTHEASITEAGALAAMQAQYDTWVKDSKAHYDELKSDYNSIRQEKIELRSDYNGIREEKIALEAELNRIKKSAGALSRKVNKMTTNCKNACYDK